MNRRTGNIFRSVLVTAAALLLQVVPGAARAAAPPELAGVWQGKLVVDASNSLAVQFTFTKGANGAYTAVLNSPDNPALKDTAVSGVTWDGTNLKLTVPSLSGSFAGALKDGKVDGKWTQPGGALPLVLSPYTKPVMSAANAKSLAGSWTGTLQVANGVTQNVVFEFKQGAGGFEGTLGLPDNNVNLKMSSVVLESGDLALKIPQGQMILDYKGKLTGDQINGKLKVPSMPQELTLNLKRGEYKLVMPPLKLSAEAFAQLKGKWTGKMETTLPANPAQGAAAAAPQKITINTVLRFEANAKGEYTGVMDATIVGQGSQTLVISEATFADGKLTFKMPARNVEYTGTVSGNTVTGEWKQGAQNMALVLTRTP
jgi:hypothetical protein